MSELLNSYNLCPICRLTETCSCPEKSTGIIAQCDNFKLDIQALNNLREISEGSTSINNEKLPLNGNANSALMGLCNFCNKRDTCQLPKPEGGIWHCRDFSQ